MLPELSTTMPLHVIWQKTRLLQPKVKVAVDEMVKVSMAEVAILGP
ncbi:protein of unknown function [Burkholderia multivorans]